MRQITNSTGIVAYPPRSSRRRTTQRWWPVWSVSAAAAMLLALMTGPLAGQGDTRSQADLYAWLQTDTRHDHAGLSTVVVAGQNRFVFDCGQTEDEFGAKKADAVRALFLTRLDDATTNGFERLLDSARNKTDAESPLRVWGPRGTREWMRQRFGDSLVGGLSGRQLTAVDIEEGSISESDGLTVLAIAIDDGHLAYRVTYKGQSMLIANDVTLSAHLLELTQDLDVAIVRHTAERRASEFLNAARPRLAVLAQDGVPASATGIRESYHGALQMILPGQRRVDVPIRNVEQGRAAGGRP